MKGLGEIQSLERETMREGKHQLGHPPVGVYQRQNNLVVAVTLQCKTCQDRLVTHNANANANANANSSLGQGNLEI
jgi:hypothetical protein